MDDLSHFLRPAGGGIHTVSTGRAEREALQRALYDARDEAEVAAKWRAALASIDGARVAMLGIPSDCGAGLVRGAAFGPEAVRAALVRRMPDFPARAARAGIVDVGDVFCVPQLLTDDMLSDEQRRRTRVALYGPQAAGLDLPVAPLSIAERVVGQLLAARPGLRIFMLGGDHSVAWPVVAAHRAAPEPALGDRSRRRAHRSAARAAGRPDLLRHLGLPRQRAPRPGRAAGPDRRADLVALEAALGVDARRAADSGPTRCAPAAPPSLTMSSRTCGRWASRACICRTTSTPRTARWRPRRARRSPTASARVSSARSSRGVGAAFPLLGADVVEVAPSVGSREDALRTADVAASYVQESLAALAGAPDLRPAGD